MNKEKLAEMADKDFRRKARNKRKQERKKFGTKFK